MTTVRELIRDSSFTTADKFDELKPEVSIFLPTFRRGDNGFLKRAVDSVLNQTFKDFELIIIDDASTDSTAEVISEFMKKDARVAVIRHARNIGLPAVSEYEAYIRSRADRLAFMFDDNIMQKDGLERLMRDQKDNPDHLISYGLMRMLLPDGETVLLGKGTLSRERLSKGNFIGNASFLINKKAIEKVGFYDPHLAMMRACDWDLWLRLLNEFPFYFVDALISDEAGMTQSDSLGNSIFYSDIAARRHMALDRNERLSIKNMPDYDFDVTPDNVGEYYFVALSEITNARFNGYYQLKHNPRVDNGYILLCDDKYSSAVQDLFSKQLEKDSSFFVTYNDFRDNFYESLGGAKAVVLSGLPPKNILKFLQATNCFFYYFITDDFIGKTENLKYLKSKEFQEEAGNLKGILVESDKNISAIKECFGTDVYPQTEWKKVFLHKTVPPFFKLCHGNADMTFLTTNSISIAETFICTLFYYLSGKTLFKEPIKFNKKFFKSKLKKRPET